MIGEIRLINSSRVFERSTMAVTAGVSMDGMIGIVDAEALVVAGDATWLWRDDCQLEAARVPQQPAESLSAPEQIMPGKLSLDAILARFARADAIYGKMEPLRPVGPNGEPLSEEALALYREAYPEDEL